MSNSKRIIAASVRISESDLKKLEAAAKAIWPKAILSRSSIILGLALIGAESVMEQYKKPK